MPEKYLKKVCLLGDGGVGKTSLIRKFVFDQFDDKYIVTIGTKVVKKEISVSIAGLDAVVTLMIWDILGQKMHDSLHASYYRGAGGALLVCDILRRETFDHLLDWINVFRKSSPDAPFIILANKSDLSPWSVLKEDLDALAAKYNSTAYITSAKTGMNVEEAFRDLAVRMCTHT